MQEHCGPDADRYAVHRGDQGLFDMRHRVEERENRALRTPWRVREEVLQVVARRERIRHAVHEDCTDIPVALRTVQGFGESLVHPCGQGVRAG